MPYRGIISLHIALATEIASGCPVGNISIHFENLSMKSITFPFTLIQLDEIHFYKLERICWLWKSALWHLVTSCRIAGLFFVHIRHCAQNFLQYCCNPYAVYVDSINLTIPPVDIWQGPCVQSAASLKSDLGRIGLSSDQTRNPFTFCLAPFYFQICFSACGALSCMSISKSCVILVLLSVKRICLGCTVSMGYVNTV